MILPTLCPICQRPVTVVDPDPPPFPFCSVRCRQVDLYRWFEGKYAIVEELTPEKLGQEHASQNNEIGEDFADPEE